MGLRVLDWSEANWRTDTFNDPSMRVRQETIDLSHGADGPPGIGV